jgi:hypothetical protein
MALNNYDYFLRRAREEDEAAQAAACIEAKICHQTLANAYRSRCTEFLLLGNGYLKSVKALQEEARVTQ